MRLRAFALTVLSVGFLVPAAATMQASAAVPAAAPTINRISPARGVATGGWVRITGPYVAQATAVSVDGVDTSAFQVDYAVPHTIQVSLPAHAPGQISITVSNADGTSAPVSYTYLPQTSEKLRSTLIFLPAVESPGTTVSCPTRRFCMAIGTTNKTYRWNGRSWRHAGSITTELGAAADVSCASPTLCVATADMGIFTWTGGTTWRQFSHGGGAVSCPTAKDCVVVTVRGVTWTGNGRWHKVGRVDPADHNTGVYHDLSCATANYCLIGGGTNVWRFDGTAWHQTLPTQTDAPRTGIGAVSCAARGFCMVIDDANRAFPLKNGHWRNPHLLNPVRLYPPPPPPGSGEQDDEQARNAVTGLACATRRSCDALEGNGRTFSYNGRHWTDRGIVDRAHFGTAYSVSCPVRKFCQVANVGDVLHFDGKKWSAPRTIDPQSAFTAQSCAGPDFCMLVGMQGAATMTVRGTHVSAPRVALPFARSRQPLVSCASKRFCAVVSGPATASFVGGHWSTARRTGVSRPASLGCASRTLCAVVSTSGAAAVWDGARWRGRSTRHAEPDGVHVSCAGDRCVSVGADGKAQVFRHGSWSKPKLVDPYPFGLQDVSCASATMCMAVSAGGSTAYIYNGRTWSAAIGVDGTAGNVASVSCATAKYCVMQKSARSYIYTAQGWNTVVHTAQAQNHPFGQVTCGARRRCLASGPWPTDPKAPPQLQGVGLHVTHLLH